MRVWDKISPEKLCQKHLGAEHRETLAIWSILISNKKGYSNHPEVKRWKDHKGALMVRHGKLVYEARRRGYSYKHLHGIFINYTDKLYEDPEPWDDQVMKLSEKNCKCQVV